MHLSTVFSHVYVLVVSYDLLRVDKELERRGFFFFFQAEDGIRDRSPSRGLGDVYKRQCPDKAGRPA